MSKVKVLFFAADPLSIGGEQPRLQLDEEAREIRHEMERARHGDAVTFESRWATRTKDLGRELLQVQPHIVHFSGHGGSKGLVLEADDRQGPHYVGAAALKKFFRAYRDQIQVVVLNACHSRPQAEAIAEAVGCAIGTPDRIGDKAALTFSASFYSSIAYGQSVQAAFDQACAMLKMKGFVDHEDPELVVRPGLDPSKLFLIPDLNILPPPKRRYWKAAGWTVLSAAVMVVSVPPLIIDPIRCAPARKMARIATASGRPPVQTLAWLLPFQQRSPEPRPDSTAVPRELVNASKLHTAGDHAGEVAEFRKAAARGIPSGMTALGIAQLNGEGTPIQADSAIDWLRRAAEKGDVRAKVALANAYRRRDGVTRDLDYRARELYEEAGLEGNAEAMYNLAVMYRDGAGGPADETLAFEWFEKAARAGYVDALVDIGWAYQQGHAVPRNEKVAMCWYRAAEKAGSRRGRVSIE